VSWLLAILGAGAICVLADRYRWLLERWCPPDPKQHRAPQIPVALLRQQRMHREAVRRYWERHPYDQELDDGTD
jgi:hypothetical protein